MDLYNNFTKWKNDGKQVLIHNAVICTCGSEEQAKFIANRLNLAARSENFMRNQIKRYNRFLENRCHLLGNFLSNLLKDFKEILEKR